MLTSRRSCITASLIASLLVLVCPSASLAQDDRVWYVLERFLPKPATRTDWITISKAEGGLDGWRIISRAPMTWTDAATFADDYRLGGNFRSACDKSYSVYRNPDNNQLGVSRDSVPSRLLVKPWVCCEEAFEMAFPTPPGATGMTNDCRTVRLLSGGSARITPWGWIFEGTPGGRDPRDPIRGNDRGTGQCRPVRRINQPESRDANGRVLTEAANINVMNCQGREVYIYEYMNRRGFRAIQPPNWATPIGGRDFGSYEEALQAVEAPDKKPPIVNPYEKYKAYWGTWRGTKVANGITIVINPDGSGSYVDTRRGYERNTPNGKWAAGDPANCIVAIHFNLCIQPDGTARDPWLNVYTK